MLLAIEQGNTNDQIRDPSWRALGRAMADGDASHAHGG
jgi:hypothetical protein